MIIFIVLLFLIILGACALFPILFKQSVDKGQKEMDLWREQQLKARKSIPHTPGKGQYWGVCEYCKTDGCLETVIDKKGKVRRYCFPCFIQPWARVSK